jgi:YHS domain-containing protein
VAFVGYSSAMKSAVVILCLSLSSLAAAAPAQPLCGVEGGHHEANQAPAVFNAPQKVGTKASCPISGEEFTITAATAHSEYKGRYVYFCCPGCKSRFDKDPEKYLGQRS